MAWLGKFSSGGFPDLAGAVNKLSESVKNIEKNFDNALGLEEKSESGEGTKLHFSFYFYKQFWSFLVRSHIAKKLVSRRTF